MQLRLLYRRYLTAGYRTGDIMSEGCTLVGTKEMGDLIAKEIIEFEINRKANGSFFPAMKQKGDTSYEK